MEVDKLELDSEDEVNVTSQTRNVRKNIPLKKDSSKIRGRPRKTSRNIKIKKSTSKLIILSSEADEDLRELENVHKKLESSGFNISEKGPPEPMHRNQKLKWDYKVNLVGEKVVDPRIHSCEKCSLPILIYGRMIPCKHVFCFDCAKQTDKHCPRCSESVQRIEQSALGTVFMCTYGGSRHGTGGCRRTYLSQRDLQAHINHRHLRSAENQNSQSSVPKILEYEPRVHNLPVENIPSRHHPPPENVMYQRQNEDMHLHQNHPMTKAHNYISAIPVMTNTRTNLITVPIQDDTDFPHPERPIYKPQANPPMQSPSPVNFGPSQPAPCNPHPGQQHCPPPMQPHMPVNGPLPIPSYNTAAPPMNSNYPVPPMQPGVHAPPLNIRPHGPMMQPNQGMYTTMAPLHPGPSGPGSAPPHHVGPGHPVMQQQPHPHPQSHPQPHPQNLPQPHPQNHPQPHSQNHPPNHPQNHPQGPHPQNHPQGPHQQNHPQGPHPQGPHPQNHPQGPHPQNHPQGPHPQNHPQGPHPQNHPQGPHPQNHPQQHPQPHPVPPIRYDTGPIHMNQRHPPNFEEPHMNSPPYNQQSNISPCAPWTTPNINQPPPQRNLPPPTNNPPMVPPAPHIPPDKNVYRPYYQ